MVAKDRGRQVAITLVALASIGVVQPPLASAQQGQGLGGFIKSKMSPPPASKPVAQPEETPTLTTVRVPTNATDPIAVVNGEIITRQQLADECVARKGSEILETLIARRLIEQAIRRGKLDITAVEIDQEIDSVAMSIGKCTREVWLRNLDKERGISPATYARDIIYPSIALRKLAMPRVEVTEKDIQDAFVANYGPRMRCRIIMTKDIRTANEVWEELRKNPGGFENLAKTRSLDPQTRSVGGMLPDLMARHAYPRNVSDTAFAQLVDGDPKDSNPAHKPKDGDFTGPIQVNEGAWIIMKREELLSGNSVASPNDTGIRNQLRDQMFDVKLKDAVNVVYDEIMQASKIENFLTGTVKEAHEEKNPDYLAGKQEGVDRSVKRMSVPNETPASTAPKGVRPVAPNATSPAGAARPPAGIPAGAASAASKFQQTIQNSPPGTPRP